MPAEGANLQKDLNPLANAEFQFEEAAARLNLPEGLKEVIKRPRRATIVSLPISMDDGTLKVFTGYRVQHSIVRGPAKGGIRYHPDVTLDVNGGIYRFRIEGREKYLDMVREGAHAEMIMQHNGHHPEIELTSPTEASGIWYLQDSVWEFRRKLHITGAAIYRDRYLKVNGSWLLKDIGFERIHEIVENLEKRPNVTFSYLATHARQLPPGELAAYQKD
jgi:bile-acid 7alpha-dehydratase